MTWWITKQSYGLLIIIIYLEKLSVQLCGIFSVKIQAEAAAWQIMQIISIPV